MLVPIAPRVTEFMNSASFKNLAQSKIFEWVYRTQTYNGLIQEEFKDQYERKFDEFAIKLGESFFRISSSMATLKFRDKRELAYSLGDDVSGRDIDDFDKFLRKLQQLSVLSDYDIRCEGLTIFANRDQLTGPIPFSVDVDVNGTERKVRVHTVNQAFMDSLKKRIQYNIFDHNFQRYFDSGREWDNSFIILVCDRDINLKILAFKFMYFNPKTPEWNITGTLGNPSQIPGLGKLIISAITSLARFYKVKTIGITSDPLAFGFYEKIGFRLKREEERGQEGYKYYVKDTGFEPRRLLRF